MISFVFFYFPSFSPRVYHELVKLIPSYLRFFYGHDISGFFVCLFVFVFCCCVVVVVFVCVCVFFGGGGRLLYLSSTYSNEVNMGVGYSEV